MEKRIKYKLIVNGVVLTKQDEATIEKLIEQHSLEQVEQAIDKLILDKKPISELKIGENETISDKNIGLAKEIAETIVIYSCAKRIDLDDDYWKTNQFSDTTDDEFKLGLTYLKQNREEMLELYEKYKI